MLTHTEKKALATILANQGLIMGLLGQISVDRMAAGRDRDALQNRILVFVDDTKAVMTQLVKEFD